MTNRTSFVFYKSFYEAINQVPEHKPVVLDAICRYQFEGVEPDLNGVPKAIWMLIKPQLDANNKRRANGQKGGRPKTEPKPNHNLTITKHEPNANVNGNVNANGNVKKENIKRKNYGEFENVKLSDDEYGKLIQKWKGDHLLKEGIEILSAYIAQTSKRYKSHYAVLGVTGWVYKRAVVEPAQVSEKKEHDYDRIKRHNAEILNNWEPKE